MIAEESTAWPMVSRPTDTGGLGFGLKWNMGWMHDTLEYMQQDPLYRRYHHGQLTFSLIYAFNENFVLPLSHDEVVYGKGSLIGKMPGDDWQQFANLRALFGYMWGHPGKKLLFMGGEFGQRREWTHEGELEWWVTSLPEHAGVQRLGARSEPRVPQRARAVPDRFFSRKGSSGSTSDNADASVIAFLRKGGGETAPVLVVCNFTPRAAHQFPDRRAEARYLARDIEQRRARLWRCGMGKLGRRGIGPGVQSRPRRVGESHPAASFHPHAEVGTR